MSLPLLSGLSDLLWPCLKLAGLGVMVVSTKFAVVNFPADAEPPLLFGAVASMMSDGDDTEVVALAEGDELLAAPFAGLSLTWWFSTIHVALLTSPSTKHTIELQ